MADEVKEPDTQIRIDAVGDSSIKDAEFLVLSVQGPHAVVIETAGALIEFLHELFGAEVTGIHDGAGNDLSFGPEQVDVLSTGDPN